MAVITGELVPWDKIKDQNGGWPTLLIGNGVSINIWSGFSYKRLFTKAQFSGPAEDIFTELNTKNFEAVLEGLWHAQTVLTALGRRTSQVDALYDEVRAGLFNAVGATHVPWTMLPSSTLDQVAGALDAHESVFTLNYDLLTYWALMNSPMFRIADFFWSGGNNTFDPDSTEVFGGVTALYFLHGGIHLWQNVVTGEVGKWTTQGGADLLSGLRRRYRQSPDRQPLFVSEGTTRHKRRTIRRSEYLNFALAALRDDTENTVIIGTSLSPQDDHIVNALVHGPSRRLAVGLRPGSQLQVAEDQALLLNRLAGHRVHFFDVETHPLGDPGLHVNP